MSPQRIQLSRVKGWRKPEGAVVVARPSKWGNPFYVRDTSVLFQTGDSAAVFWCDRPDVERARTFCVAAYRSWVNGTYPGLVALENRLATLHASLGRLAGEDLACWCPLDQPCHADVLLEVANA